MPKKVVVFGSVNLDLFFEVQDLRFFAALGPKAEAALHFPSMKQAPGGKGANQALAAAKAGAKVHFFGAVGSDPQAQAALAHFKPFGVSCAGIKKTNAPTGTAVIMTQPDGKHKLLICQGANAAAQAAQVPDSKLSPNTILSLTAEVDMKQNELLAKRAVKRGALVVFNAAPAKPVSENFLKCVDVLLVNEAELLSVAGFLGMKTKKTEETARALSERFGFMSIVTLGAKGVVAVDGAGTMVKAPAMKVRAIDTVGAGDAFAGAFVAALANDCDPEEALRCGTVAGSLACTRMGAQTALPSASEIAKFLKRL